TTRKPAAARPPILPRSSRRSRSAGARSSRRHTSASSEHGATYGQPGIARQCVVQSMKMQTITRRRFLAVAGAAMSAPLLPLRRAAAANVGQERTLSFLHTHTGEKLSVTYANGD